MKSSEEQQYDLIRLSTEAILELATIQKVENII